MDRQSKIQQILALEEKRKRQLLAKPQYEPTEGQLKVLSSKKRNIFNFSGNGGGKTTLLVNKMMAIARGRDPWSNSITKVPAKIIVVVDNTRKIDERIIPELRKWHHIDEVWLKRLGKPYTARIELDNGSVVDFYSSDADPSSFEGIEASAVLVDEPIPRTLYVALKRSLRLKGHLCLFLFCGTAISEAWLRRDIYEPWAKGELENTDCFKLASRDNQANLEEGYLEDFGRTLSESEKVVRLEGGFFDSDALALAHLWDKDKHIIPAEKFKYDGKAPCVVAIDNHSTKPHTAILVTCDRNDRLIAVKEMRLRGNAQQFATALKVFMEGYNVVDCVCDSLGSMEMTSGEGMHSFIEGLRSNGIIVRPTLFKEKSHEDLIDRMRNALVIPVVPDQYGECTPKLGILSTLKGLISDIEGATWQKNRITGEMVPKLDTSVRDHLSCLGYALATNLFYDKLRRQAPVYRRDIATPVAGSNVERSQRRAAVISERKTRLGNRRLRALAMRSR